MNSSSHSVYQQLRPGIILGIIIIFGLMILGDVNNVSQQFLLFQWKYFGLAIAFTLVNYIFRFLKRHYCLNRSGVSHFSIKKSLQLFIAGIPLAVTPMKVGESFKGIWLNRFSGLPVEKAVSVFLFDHISDGLSVFLLMAFGTIAFPTLWPYFLLVFVLFLVTILFLQIKPVAQNFLNVSEKLPYLGKIIPELRRCVDGNPDLFRFGPFIFSSLLGLVSWVADGAALVSIMIGLGFSFSWALVGTALLVFSFSMILGIISSLPAGIGVMELSMAVLLTIILGYRPEIAAAATIIFRVATFWIGIISGLLLWFFWGKNLGINTEEGRIIAS